MADPTHLWILGKGVDFWNDWRKNNPEIVPDLSSANLTTYDLVGANLAYANLFEADLHALKLSKTDLSNAYLCRTNLGKADLRGANLNEAKLCQIDLSTTSMRRAQLQKATIYNVTLPVELIEVDFEYATLHVVHLAGSGLISKGRGIITETEAFLESLHLEYFDDCEVYLNGAQLKGANLRGVHLRGVYLENANLTKARLSSANMNAAKLSGAILNHATMDNTSLEDANLTGAELQHADLYTVELLNAQLIKANLTEAILEGTVLNGANLTKAILTNANMSQASLVGTNLTGANLDGCNVYGISAWDLELDDALQKNLIISRDGKTGISVDDIEVAQFIYLLINNENIRKVINNVTSKSVLILGRFYKERKEVLDALREELRKKDLAPIVFDFEPSKNRDLTETVQLLASMSKFVIADVTDAKSIPQELSVIIPHFPSVPVLPILLEGEKEYSMFEHWKKYPSVLAFFEYQNKDHLIDNIDTGILEPIEKWKNRKNELQEKDEEIERLKEELKQLQEKK